MELQSQISWELNQAKIGETFKLSENTSKILPQVYGNGSIGFIVIKVDHTVGDNGWTTEVGALMYNLTKLSGGSSALLSGAGSATAGSIGVNGFIRINKPSGTFSTNGTPVTANFTASAEL